MATKYMMATKAIHKSGDISRDTPDLCIVDGEDADNYIGNWITGFGFCDVKFPKATTKELSTQDIEHYHGMVMELSGQLMPALNITGENFRKQATITNDDTGESYHGELWAPIKVGGCLAMMRDDGLTFRSSTVRQIVETTDEQVKVRTRNSVYVINIYENQAA